MTPASEPDSIVGQGRRAVRRLRFSIRSLMILIVVVAGVLAWSIQHLDRIKDLYLFRPAIPVLIVSVSGMVWSIGKIYKNPPEKQTLSIVVLIGSLLWPILALFLGMYLLYWLGWKIDL